MAVLSEGRLRLGVGTGWNWVEYDALGHSFRSRARRLDEQIDVLQRLWSEPVVTFDGEFHHIARAGILPLPASPIPLWFGGGAEPMLQRAARHGDGFVFGRGGRKAGGAVARLRELLVDADRNPESFGFEGLLDWSLGPEACAQATEDWVAAGGTHLSLRRFDAAATFMGAAPLGYTTVDEHLGALEEFRQLVG